MRRKQTEILLAVLAVCLALCACGEPAHDHDVPEIAGPCPGPTVRSVQRLNDGTVLLVVSR